MNEQMKEIHELLIFSRTEECGGEARSETAASVTITRAVKSQRACCLRGGRGGEKGGAGPCGGPVPGPLAVRT